MPKKEDASTKPEEEEKKVEKKPKTQKKKVKVEKKPKVEKKKAKTEKKKPTKKTEAKKPKKSQAKKEVKKITKKTAPKKEKKTKSIFISYVAEAIAAQVTEEKRWVSLAKIREYIYKYIGDIKVPAFVKHNTKVTVAKMVERKELVQKKNSYRFTSKGEEKLKPAAIPKRKVVREETKETPEEEKQEKKVIVTSSGRVSTKVY